MRIRDALPIALVASALSLPDASRLEASPPAAALERIEVYPSRVSLESSRDHQSLVVQAVHSDGTTRDVTDEVRWSLLPEGCVRRDAAVLHPAQDGQCELKVEFEGMERVVPVEVRRAKEDRPISFRLDVMPAFTKASCNTGACHGASRGKDGFRLSLFGYDPAGDYHRLTREMPGRRLNLALPEESLILQKGTGKVQHTGGQRLEEGDELYRAIVRWLDAGSPDDPRDVAEPLGIEIYPPRSVLVGEGATQQMTVRAKYSDGTDRDVTHLAYFFSSNDNSAAVTPRGVVTAARRGEAFIMARFDAFTVGVPVIVLPEDTGFEFPALPEKNYIDTLVHAKLRNLRIVPSEVASDEVFLRRVFLDITGTLPTVKEWRRFTEDTSPDKREKLVDELLGRKEFVELWVMKWAELLQIRSSQQVSYKAMLLYYSWLQERLQNEVPIDRMVRDLLQATGGTFSNPATNYYQAERDTLKVAENVAQVFLGMRIQCAQCHNHPFDRWTQDDYYGFAAFFSQIGRKRAEDPRETIVFNRGGGEVRHPVTNQVVPPKFLGGERPDVKGKDRRAVLAGWLASPQNPYFARNVANIVWAHFFGRGIIHEVDDVRVSNPPSNAELLDELARRFTEYGYDFKKLVRDICTSRTYQLDTLPNETNQTDTTNFSRGAVRRIRAEVLLDAIGQVTETDEKFRGLPRGARAVQIADGSTSNYFLTTFGRAKRETVCSCEVKMEPTLSQALHLLNGNTVTQRIRQGGWIRERLKEGKKPDEVIEEMTIRALARRPTEAESAAFADALHGVDNPEAVLEDIFWSILNSREFLFNH